MALHVFVYLNKSDLEMKSNIILFTVISRFNNSSDFSSLQIWFDQDYYKIRGYLRNIIAAILYREHISISLYF